jgi:endonuclease-3
MAKAAKAGKKSARPRREPATQGVTIEGIPFELPPTTDPQRARASEVLSALEAEYPTAHCELNYTKPHELLIATILSAQTTDVGVNKATPALFKRFPNPADYAAAKPEDIEPYVKSLGFFRNKAKAVHLAMKAVVERHGGEVPRTMEELLDLQGVARKTANVVLGNAFGMNEGFVVDTHVERLSRRFGLVPDGVNVQAIERWLMALFPRDRWCQLSHMLIWHGRRACSARGVKCSEHPICARFGVACELRDLPVTAQQMQGTVGGNRPGKPAGTARTKVAKPQPAAPATRTAPKKKAR